MLATVFIIMEIQKYKAKIKGTDTEVIGYITEAREQLGQGTYGNGTDYLISVTEKSMPNGKYGTFKVDKETIKPILNNEKFLIDFIRWAERCSEDAFYIFDNPKDAVNRFLNGG
jgi:hypothetical protein